MLNPLTSIVSKFLIPGTFIRADHFGSGLINATYLCEFKDGIKTRKYILQCINGAVFKNPEDVMKNIETVTAHIAEHLRSRGIADPAQSSLMLIRTRENLAYLRDESHACWRMFNFIDAGEVFDRIRDRKHAYEVGRGLGAFQALLADLHPSALNYTLPGFHDTQAYLDDYDVVLHMNLHKRATGILAERDFINQRRFLAPLLTRHIASNDVPLRVVHNDPKVNNILIHRTSGEALCMIDLDTVMPGIVHFDFGDCVRSVANPAGEDAQDLDAVMFDLALLESVSQGYFHEVGYVLTRKEVSLLPAAVKVITFELGIRFLADYLRGDTYFKTLYPSHNLHRARVQFRLLERIEAVEKSMSASITQAYLDSGANNHR